jgi:quercetin dioxygenase-like cupin family protein
MKFEFDGSLWVDKNGYRTMKVFSISDDSFLQIVEIKGSSNVRKHYHISQTEVFYILEGVAVLGLGEEEYIARPGDIFLCRPETVHWVINESNKPFRLLVFKYGWKENDLVWVQD